MNTNRDLRVQKIYDALISAFELLLLEKSFEEISVKDKYDFFAFLVKELRERYLNISPLQNETEPSTQKMCITIINKRIRATNRKLVNGSIHHPLQGLKQYLL